MGLWNVGPRNEVNGTTEDLIKCGLRPPPAPAPLLTTSSELDFVSLFYGYVTRGSAAGMQKRNAQSFRKIRSLAMVQGDRERARDENKAEFSAAEGRSLIVASPSVFVAANEVLKQQGQ